LSQQIDILLNNIFVYQIDSLYSLDYTSPANMKSRDPNDLMAFSPLIPLVGLILFSLVVFLTD
jgi:hypothetical protein